MKFVLFFTCTISFNLYKMRELVKERRITFSTHRLYIYSNKKFHCQM